MAKTRTGHDDASAAPRKGARSSTGSARRASVRDKLAQSSLMNVPAQIMGPRLLFIAATAILCVFGLVMVYSASSIAAFNDFHNASYYFERQAMFLAMGVVLCVIVAKIPYQVWAKPAVFATLWVLSCLMLAATAFGLGVSALGAERSILIGGFALQPAEFAKIAVMMAVGALITMLKEGTYSYGHMLAFAIVAGVVPLILIYKQPDLGTAIILAVGIIAMAVLAGIKWRIVFGILALLALYVVYSCITQPYHMDRIIAMFDPWLDPQGNGYQSIQSLYAFGSGGIFGTGLGLSRQKYLYLPYAHTDFIFAIVGEELGIIGALSVVVLFGVFIVAGMRISRTAPDLFGCLLSGGLTVMVGFQACVNMACVTGIAPVTGKALPFLSYGGSSLLATLIMVGLVLSVSIQSRVGAANERRRDDLRIVEGGRSAKRDAESTRRAPERGQKTSTRTKGTVVALDAVRREKQKRGSRAGARNAASSRTRPSSSRTRSERSSQRQRRGGTRGSSSSSRSRRSDAGRSGASRRGSRGSATKSSDSRGRFR